jgi:hypothetical protein
LPVVAQKRLGGQQQQGRHRKNCPISTRDAQLHSDSLLTVCSPSGPSLSVLLRREWGSAEKNGHQGSHLGGHDRAIRVLRRGLSSLGVAEKKDGAHTSRPHSAAMASDRHGDAVLFWCPIILANLLVSISSSCRTEHGLAFPVILAVVVEILVAFFVFSGGAAHNYTRQIPPRHLDRHTRSLVPCKGPLQPTVSTPTGDKLAQRNFPAANTCILLIHIAVTAGSRYTHEAHPRFLHSNLNVKLLSAPSCTSSASSVLESPACVTASPCRQPPSVTRTS